MKKMVIEGGAMVAYIHNKDVNMLSSIYRVVNPVVFQERAIVLDQCNAEGMFRIEKPEAVSYIGKAPFILDVSYVQMLGQKELGKLLEKAAEDMECVEEVFEKLYGGKMAINQEHNEALKAIGGIDKSLIKDLKKEVKKGKKAKVEKIRNLEFYLKQQLEHYTSSLEKAAKEKEA